MVYSWHSRKRSFTHFGTTRQKILGYGLTTLGILGIVYGGYNLTLGAAALELYGILAFLIGIELIAFGLSSIFGRVETHLSDRSAVEARDRANTVATTPIKEQLKIAFSNQPFLYIIGIYLCSWLAVQLTASILIYFVVSWMGMDEAAFPIVAIAVQGTALVMLFFWKWVSEKLDKKAVYFLGSVIWIIAQGGLFFIQPGQTTLLYILAIMAGCGVSVAYLVPWSMIPDVIELDELNTGQRREGIFYSFMVLLQKFGLALALFLVGLVLEWSGFVERPPGGDIPIQPDSALLAIRIAVAPLPMVVLIIGLILAYFYPITKEKHAEIRLKLEERK